LHPGAEAVVVVLRLDNCDREIRFQKERVIGTLALAARHQFVANDDAPSMSRNSRRDVAITNVRFGEGLLVHSLDSLVGVVGELLAISPRTAFRDTLVSVQTTYPFTGTV
jgi:hypothetical protein